MTETVTIEVEEDGTMNTRSNFDLGTTLLILEKVKNKLADRATIERTESSAGEDVSEEDEE